MKIKIFIVILFSFNLCLSFSQNPYIIDHSFAKSDTLKTIPVSWINYAKKYLHIRYEHSSHGGQLITGMNNLDAFMGGSGLYTFGANETNKLDLEDVFHCTLSSCPDSWDSDTRSYLDDPANADCNVIMWSWCDVVGTNASDTTSSGYIGKMEKLIAEYGPNGSKIQSGSRSVPVTFVFMTGHVNADNGATQLINDAIRKHCKIYSRYLYDFADIESWDPSNKSFINSNVNENCDYEKSGGTTGNWADEWISGRKGMSSPTDVNNNEPHGGKWYQCTAPRTQALNANLKAYAAWYLFAKIAGWSFGPTTEVSSINLHGLNNNNSIKTDKGSLQMVADILPQNASNKYVNWSIYSGSDLATIDFTGVLSSLKNGKVVVRADADDGSGVWDTCTVVISNQLTSVSGITVSGANNVSTITVDKGGLQMVATVYPSDASNKGITWSIQSGSSLASINSTGYLTASKNGTVTVKATANDGSGVSGIANILISNQIVLANGFTIRGLNNVNTLSVAKGTLQMEAVFNPPDVTNKTITWSVFNGNLYGSLNSTGLITAINNGTMIIKGFTTDGTNLWDTCKIYIINQPVPVSSITIRSTTNSYTITSVNGSLQMVADVSPANSTNKTVDWSIITGNNLATIDSKGKVTALKNGTVTLKATATDGSGIYSARNITITNLPTSIQEATSLIQIYPNPAESSVTIKLPWTTTTRIELVTQNGILIAEKEISATEEILPLDNINPGFYILKITHDSEVYFSKLVKQ